MADQLATGDVAGLINRVISNTQLRGNLEAIVARNAEQPSIQTELMELADLEGNDESYADILLLSLDGMRVMPTQAVKVEYLRADQIMQVPAPLGAPIAVGTPGRCAANPTLQLRYQKMAGMTYMDIKQHIVPRKTGEAIRAIVDAIEQYPPLARRTNWLEPGWPINAEGQLDDRDMLNMVMTTFSTSLMYNADVRDYGVLNQPDMSVSHTSWMTAGDVLPSRLSVKVHPLSLQSLAGLNHVPCGGVALAAWVRAYGVAIGMLPSDQDGGVREFRFTTQQPVASSRAAVTNYHGTFPNDLLSVCGNLLAMFGLMHLHKDHTFITGDSNMDRIGKSYLMTLRTDASSAVQDYMDTHREALVRTAQHPFGLAGTYWIARVMGNLGSLMLPLMKRLDVKPPPVQRAVVCSVAAAEWENMPGGKAVSDLYYYELKGIRDDLVKVAANPPSYSSLAHLYGITKRAELTPETLNAIMAVVPCVWGYVMVAHQTEGGARDGLALATSLKNVERDSKGMVIMWKQAWQSHMDDVEKGGIVAFVNQMKNSMPQNATGMGIGVGPT